MPMDNSLWAEVDEQGRLVLPPEMAERLGVKPGVRLRIEPETDTVRLHQPVTHLRKVYIEPTNRCNIVCRTCMRNTWDEPLGMMSEATFERILADLSEISPRPLVSFGGIGEPLLHPRTVDMVARLHALGCVVELITNGMLLSPKRSRQLVQAGLNTLWVSIDGASPESYEDVRLGAALPRVLENIRQFAAVRRGIWYRRPALGIAFVAMKRNVQDLPRVIKLGRSLGATKFSISNVLPYSEELADETLYGRSLKDIAYLSSINLPSVSLPKMDLDDVTREAFLGALHSGCSISLAGSKLSGANDVCGFVEGGATAIGWDGSLSPCLPLLHNQISYLRERKRTMLRHIVGNVREHSLLDLWNEPAYIAYRERVQGFAFPACTFCGGCDMLDSNQEDCIGNEFPVCGGCLWSQGVIRCP